ncbi:tRNA (mnm(5)s(2)U34)-methyltransferase [Aneurinibacillus terranovensis]|uniref:tRNA (mnm(5)s(2)U34)-methyltransferase n=1 Tax=Aneurinibacillus terranovensis TaxID=278991 RepID=UPI0004114424|nr:class I SAM-dependent methyltransferase [Aneurinibacillus terranovensis]
MVGADESRGICFPRITEMAHRLLQQRIRPGDTVIDATAGNGYDTVFLADQVGESGKVVAYDIQEKAIAATRTRLINHGVLSRVTLYHASHAEINRLTKPVAAVIFNLGYLPGSSKETITHPSTTLQALQSAVELLQPGGIIVVVVYRGHEGGQHEAEAVESYVRDLPFSDFLTLKYEYINPAHFPPYILAVERKPGRHSKSPR